MTVKEFFERAEVKALQEIQKQHPYGSPEHRAAFEKLKAMAEEVGGDIGEY